MTEWWLRKAVICHLSPIFCNYYFVWDGTSTPPLTRSVGSVTAGLPKKQSNYKFQLTRSVGSVTYTARINSGKYQNFNSHAPWGA